MADFKVHTRASAPAPSVKLLDDAESAYNHIADTPLDDAFAQDAWLPGERGVG